MSDSPPYQELAIEHGSGVVDVRGNHLASVLRLHGQPVAVDGADCAGSIARLVARAGAAPPTPTAVQALRVWLADPLPGDDLSSAAAALLQLLAPGTYGVRLRRATMVLVAEVTTENVVGWYPDPATHLYLVPTDIWPPRDQDTIERYQAAIQAGQRPAAAILRPAPMDDCAGYVLDGHHKLAAYQHAGIAPHLFEIARMTPANALIAASELDEALSRSTATARERATDRRVRREFQNLRQRLHDLPDEDYDGTGPARSDVP